MGIPTLSGSWPFLVLLVSHAWRVWHRPALPCAAIMSSFESLIPVQYGVELEQVELDAPTKRLLAHLVSTNSSATCPACSASSHHVHSHYQLRAADLPCCGWALTLELRVRRFRCPNRSCRQRVFCERLPALLTPWARRTTRLTEQQRSAALLVGGAPGEHLSRQLGLLTSRNTLLRLARSAPPAAHKPPQIIAVDD